MQKKNLHKAAGLVLSNRNVHGTTGTDFPLESWKRCEFHRNAFALLPAGADKNPGVAFISLDNKGAEYHRFCTCAVSGKRTCRHLLELSNLLRQLGSHGGTKRQNRLFEKSLWRQLASVLFENGGRFTPFLKGYQDKDHGHTSLCVLDEEGRLWLEYLSKGEDSSRFLERCIPPSQGNQTPIRADVLKKLSRMTLTENERLLRERGFKSRGQAMDRSFWNSLAYHAFREFGTNGVSLVPAIEEKTGMFSITCTNREQEPVFRLFVPRQAVRKVLEIMKKHLPNQHHMPIHPIPLKSLFKVDMKTELDLEIRPVLQMLQEDGEERFFERPDLERFRYGRLVFVPELGLMAELEDPDKRRRFGAPRKMTLKRSQVPTFIEAIRTGEDRDDFLLSPEIQRLQIVGTPDRIEINPDAIERDWCWLSVTYGFGSESVSLHDILNAWNHGQRYLSTSTGWIDCNSPDMKKAAELFGAALPEGGAKDLFKFSKMDLLRLQGTLDHSLFMRGERSKNDILSRILELKPQKSELTLKGLTSDLRTYQEAGVKWLYFLYENGLGGLLCDDMGLGKTHQIMALMVAIREESDPEARFLIVCPTTVLGHWERKLKEHAPSLKTTLFYGADRDFDSAVNTSDVIVTSYGLLRNDLELLKDTVFTMAAFDEIQYLKNTETKGYAAALEIRAEMKIGVTGTPIENHLGELKALMDLTVPGYLGTDEVFFERHLRPIQENNDGAKRKELSRLIAPFILRRLKKSVLKELPVKIEDTRFCRLSEDQVKLYRDAVDMRGKGLLEELKDRKKTVPYIHVFALLRLLKQICNHPALIKNGTENFEHYSCGKWDLFCELLTESLESGQKVVVYSQFLGMIRLFEQLVEKMGVGYVSLTGSTTKRDQVLTRFNQDEDCRVYLGSLMAGGVGVDLVAASVVIHYDRWWNAAREDQATDRVHRIGQKRGVQVFKLVTQGTLEEKIDRIIQKKRNLMESVVKEDDPGLLKSFSREDLIEFLMF